MLLSVCDDKCIFLLNRNFIGEDIFREVSDLLRDSNACPHVFEEQKI